MQVLVSEDLSGVADVARHTAVARARVRRPCRQPRPGFKPFGRFACLPRKRSGETMATDLDLLQGTLDVLVLKTLSWGPRHGYAVARWIKDASEGTIQVEDRALYVSLHRLEERGWVESAWGLSENNRKAKYYRLTAAGRRQLQAKTSYWTEYATAVVRILQTA
jgi:PadR family transcriptional regulator, regulatory protein PadR